VRPLLLVVAWAALSAGCLGPAADPTKVPVVGAGATMGACETLLLEDGASQAIVRLEDYGAGEQVAASRDRVPLGEHDVDAWGCAAVPFAGAGTYRFSGWGSCTQQAVVEWDGGSDLEVYIPYDGDACV
jgi:hypothetical protein